MGARQLRVLAVSHAYPRRRHSSHGIFIHRLHRAMREQGIHVDVLQMGEWTPPRPLSDFYRPWREEKKRQEDLLDELDGIRIHHPLVFTPRPSRFFSMDSWSRASRALARYCSRQDQLASADVVLAHFMVPDGVHALEVGDALGIPVAALAWGDDVHAWPANSVAWRDRLVQVLERVDLPLACSRRLASDADAWLDMPRGDWQIVYAGIALDVFAPSSERATYRASVLSAIPAVQAENVHVLFMVGQAVRAKGYLELLNAWADVAPIAKTWHLVMAGTTGDLDIAALVAERGLESRAHWIGEQPADRMPDLMRAADAFVLPSHNEGLSISVLEALASGLPTITTDVGGHAEVIQHHDEGWLIEPRNEAQLGRALKELVTHADRRLKCSVGGRRAAERIGSPGINACRLAQHLDDLAARRPRQSAAVARGDAG
jgi:glycosyltransferase involved in cell wall biosynthesis